MVVSGLPQQRSWLLVILGVAFIASIGRPAAIGPIQMSVAGIVQIASIPLLGPVGAALVGAIPVLVDRNAPLKRIFNISQRVLFLLAGSFAYALAGGETLTQSGDGIGPLALAAAMAAAAATAAGVNAFLLSGVLQRSSAGSLRRIALDLVKQVVPAYASYGIAAYLLVVLWAPAGLGWASILFFLPSIFTIQWGLHQHSAQWATRHAILNPFVVALDLRRPGAADEARLAAGAATAIANGLGLTPALVDNVATAAQLRDVGMLALDGAPPAIMRRDHSTAARRVVGTVSFLHPTLTMIDAHHERVDGHGHPLGLAGEQIPVGGRVLAVADTWAQLVAEGWSPRDAVDHCESVVGQSLDEACVAALRRALERDQLPASTT